MRAREGRPPHIAIDTSRKWWRGEDFADLAEYIRNQTADGYPAERVIQAVCACGSTSFRLDADQDEGCARRTCIACNAQHFICDSSEYWAEAEPERWRCPNRHTTCEIGVGFSFTDDEVRWITVGERCVRCGILSSFVDWKIDYAPTGHLLGQI